MHDKCMYVCGPPTAVFIVLLGLLPRAAGFALDQRVESIRKRIAIPEQRNPQPTVAANAPGSSATALEGGRALFIIGFCKYLRTTGTWYILRCRRLSSFRNDLRTARQGNL